MEKKIKNNGDTHIYWVWYDEIFTIMSIFCVTHRKKNAKNSRKD